MYVHVNLIMQFIRPSLPVRSTMEIHPQRLDRKSIQRETSLFLSILPIIRFLSSNACCRILIYITPFQSASAFDHHVTVVNEK